VFGTNVTTTINLQGQRRTGLLGRLATWILAPAAPASAEGNATPLAGLELDTRPIDRIAGDGTWSQGRWSRLA